MATTANKLYLLQTTGTNVGTWGTALNNSVFSIIDNNIGGTLAVNVAGSSNINLTSSQASYLTHNLTGVLTGNINYTFPTLGGFYSINNESTGAFTITVKVVGGSGGVIANQGTNTIIFVDASTPQVMSGAATPGANSNITSLTGLTTPLSVLQGGTGNASGNIPGSAPAGSLTGTALASNVVSSSLTSLGTIGTLNAGTANITTGNVTTLAVTNAITTLGIGTANITTGNVTTLAVTNAIAIPANSTAVTQASTDASTKVATTAQAASQPGVAKAYVTFAGASGSLGGHFNVTSVTRNSTGNYTVNFTSNISDTSYAVAVSATDGAGDGSICAGYGTKAVGSVVILTRDATTAKVDPAEVSVTIFR